MKHKPWYTKALIVVVALLWLTAVVRLPPRQSNLVAAFGLLVGGTFYFHWVTTSKDQSGRPSWGCGMVQHSLKPIDFSRHILRHIKFNESAVPEHLSWAAYNSINRHLDTLDFPTDVKSRLTAYLDRQTLLRPILPNGD